MEKCKYLKNNSYFLSKKWHIYSVGSIKKEKTIKITEFGMKPELVGAIIKYITMIIAPIPRPNPKPDGIPKPKRITLADVAKTLNDFILETRANFKRIDARIDKLETDINNIVLKNNLKR
jgi:hypothetical protein